MTATATFDTLAGSSVPARSAPIARVQIITDLTAAEPLWRQLETPDQVYTPYQRFDCLATWHRHIGEADGIEPFIVVAYDSDKRPAMLLPLCTKQRRGIRTAEFIGGKHVSFNMPIVRRDFARSATAHDIASLCAMLRREPGTADLLALTRQPLQWHGLPNPMSHLPKQQSVNACPMMVLTPGAPPAERIRNSFRKRLRNSERKLQALPGYGWVRATTDAEIDRFLDAFFRIKPIRMAEQNLPNVFADPNVETFIRTACHARLPSGSRAVEIHALACDAEVIAVSGGVADDHRYSMMFNTYTMSENAKHSPGLILIRNIIDDYAERGHTAFDLGTGSDDYKQLFCKADEPVYDSFVPLTARGQAAAAALAIGAAAKRRLKQFPAFMRVANAVRSAIR